MSKNGRNYDKKAINRLLVECGGRCMICNKKIIDTEFTADIIDLFERAHINAANDKGPRANKTLTEKERNDVNNLMILCPTCHTMIDNKKLEKVYTVDVLTDIKKEKIRKVNECLDIIGNTPYTIIKYVSVIGNYINPIDIKTINNICIQNGIIPDFFSYDISDHLTKENATLAKEYLLEQIKTQVNKFIENKPDKPICLFAIAPQYLLIYLGYLINSLQTVKIFTKHRNGWFYKDIESNNKFLLGQPTKKNKENKVAIKISSTAYINDERIKKVLGLDVDIWEIKAENICIDNINSSRELEDFGKKCVSCIDDIYNYYGQNVTINVFPAMCNSLAIKFGQSIFKKVCRKINIYDMNTDGVKIDKLKLTIE